MRWFLTLSLLGLLLASATFAQPPEVDQAEVLRLGNLVHQLGVGPQSDRMTTFLEAMGPPPSDADKWFISLVCTRNCAPCERLKQAFLSDPWLQSLANPHDPRKSWSHYNVYDAQDRSQAFRFEKLQIEAYPTILIQPPRSKKYGDPTTVVFQGTYHGDPKQLATEMTTAIRRYLAKFSEAKAQREPAVAQTGYGADPPWQPVPKVDPVLPTPTVDVVQIPPPVTPAPVTPAPITPAPVTPAPVDPAPAPVKPGPEPISPVQPSVRLEAVVVTDADRPSDSTTETRIREVIQGLRKQRGLQLKVRRTDWQDASSRFTLQRDELPVVLVTNNGRIEDKISASLLPFVDPPALPVTLADLPWSSLVTLVTTGLTIPALIALAIWGLSYWRSYRQQTNQPVLLNDATFQQLLDFLQKWEGQRVLAGPSPAKTSAPDPNTVAQQG